MRNVFLVSMCALLLATAACGSSSNGSNDPDGGEIRSEEDVRQFFQALMPDLVAALTELANDPSFALPALSASTDKGGSSSSTVQCPEDGWLSVDPSNGQATATDCGVRGITFSAQLQLFVFATPPSYEASFTGTLVVTGTFTGTVVVNSALIQWTDPATDANTYWQVTVTVNELLYIVTSGDSGNGLDCTAVNGFGSVPMNGPCDDDSDCESGSCRDPEQNPSEGCTCRRPDGGGGDCSACVGTNAAAPNQPPDPATACEPGAVNYECSCATERGNTVVFALSPTGCY